MKNLIPPIKNWKLWFWSKKVGKELFTNEIISDDDVNKELFPKFCFSGQKFIYAKMQEFSQDGTKGQFERLKLFFMSPFGVFGTVFLLLLVLCGIFIPFSTQSPYEISATRAFFDFGQGGHILGTDNLGRDIWARTWWGLRNSIGIGVAAVSIDIFLGVILGLLMGYYRNFDRIMSFVIKILNTVPSTIILIFISVVLTANVGTIILGIIITGWIQMTLQVRGYVLRIVHSEFVISSKLLDTPNRFIIKDFIPFILPAVFSTLIQTIPYAILADTSLALLGIVVPNLPTLGSTMNAAMGVITLYPQQLTGPLFVITFLIFNVKMIHIGFNDAFRRSR